jgi:hypothetical protein
VNTPAIDESKLAGIVLLRGSHETQEEGMCLLEAVAYVAGEEHTDRPICVDTLLAEMGRELNDLLPDDLRQLLMPVIPDLPGTADDGFDLERSYMALDWLVRVCLLAWLEHSPACREVASNVRGLDMIVDTASAERAVPVVRHAQQTARDAAEATAKNAAGVAAGVAASAAGAVSWSTAWIARKEAADADVVSIAWFAASDTWMAATWDTTDALRPTVEALQISAIELFTRMARLGHKQPTT